MHQTTIELSRVQIKGPRTQPIETTTVPEPPLESTLDDRNFTFGFGFWLRALFVDVLAMMRRLQTHTTAYTIRQCPSVSADQVFEKRNRVFETKVIELSSDIKQGENAPASKSILLLFRCFQTEIAIMTTLLLVEMISRCSIPFIIEALLLQQSQSWILAVLIFTLIFGLILRHNNWRYGQYINVRIRTMLAKTLYKKLMRVGTSTLKSLQLSRLVNLLTSDMNAIELKLQYLFITFTTPVTLIYCLVMLVLWNGEEGIIGFVYFTSMFIFHVFINNRLSSLTSERSVLAEQRIKMFKESLDAIRLLKVYTWETTFRNFVCCLKEKETRVIMFRYLLLVTERALSLSSAAVSSVLIFVSSYYVEGGKLKVASIFATLQLFMLMRFNVMFFSQIGIDHYFELKEIMDRFMHIMEVPEKHMTNNRQEQPGDLGDLDENVAVLSDVSVYWTTEKNILSNVNLKVQRGQKYSLVGKVGQGKSTFMQFLLREVNEYAGTARITENISCSEQTSFICSGTIKDNILFGRPQNPVIYRKVLEATCLSEDLQLFEKHDMTQVQEDGQNLSGGQKSRIGLARSLYQESDLYLFDDPLSAVDERVAVRIIHNMFSDLLRDKAVIVSTSNPNLLRYFNYHLSLEQTLKGTTIICSKNHQVLNKPHIEHINIIQHQRRPNLIAKKKLPSSTLTLYGTYIAYAKQSAGVFQWIIVLILFIGCQVIFSIYVRDLADISSPSTTIKNWIQVLSLSFSLILVYFFKYLLLVHVVTQTNCRLHNRVYTMLLGGTTGFFQQTDRSDLISRFSNDINILDTNLPLIFCDSIESILYFLNLMVVISVKVPYWAITIPFIFLVIGVIYKKCTVLMQKSKMLDLKMKAPVIASFTDLMKGATQIRCFKLDNLGFQRVKQKLLASHRANYLFNCLQRGFGFYVQGGTLIFSIIAILLTYFTSWDLYSGQELIYSIALSDYIQFGIRQISTLDGFMMSVQRILTLENVPQEENGVVEELPEQWPQMGQVQFKDVTMRYDNGKEALRNVSFIIEGGKKTGCLGRTGAGKSSILNALFRFQPIDSGIITIDGVDIRTISINRLRNSLGIIPQTPFVFSGTLRENIDPHNEYTDEQIAQLLNTVEMPEQALQLNTPNLHLTLGQKQLVCLCRCILKNPRILILDEATASIDSSTDELVQKIIRKYFKNTTIFSIAHRINTISDSEILLEVQDGQITTKKVYNSYRELLVDTRVHLDSIAIDIPQ